MPRLVGPDAGLLVAGLAPALTAVRLSLHVLGAAVWVGGQITMVGLLPAARRAGPDAPRSLGRAFSRLQWPAYVLLVGTGVWNVTATAGDQAAAWNVVLGVKIAVVAAAGLGAWLHGRARSKVGLAVWGAMAAAASIAALVLGVLLAG